MPSDESANATRLCRDCGALGAAASGGRCRACGSIRAIAHPEIAALSIAHLDCDAFYASVEKRDAPHLAEKPVIVGGRERGVVLACCYVARLYGVRSAMPMFKALEACPDAVVIRPDMAKYRAVGRAVRALMQETTPLVEPLSIDEAFLDLTGTELVHGGPPAVTLVRLARRIEAELGVTVSIGLSFNKFLAKLASDLDKPRGFAVIGRAEATEFLAGRPVGVLWGVGPALQRRLARDGILRIGQLQEMDEAELTRRYGSIGSRLWRFSRADDRRRVEPNAPVKSVSTETTFRRDIDGLEALRAELRPLCDELAATLRRKDVAALGISLKLKTGDFQLRTRARRLVDPTQRPELIFATADSLLQREIDGTFFRLIGVGAEPLAPGRDADPPDLFRDGEKASRLAAARAALAALSPAEDED